MVHFNCRMIISENRLPRHANFIPGLGMRFSPLTLGF
jgi:hypothetical protein